MGMEYEIGLILAYGFGIALLYLAGYLLLAPLKVLGKFFVNSLLGGAALIIINFLGDFLGFHLPINFFSAIIAGFLGVPGVALLFLLEKMP
ncbi:MAG: pro-sigmaK processing inhibitor BofA family protein [Firmicutes bacterium]|nr:pro-sigmaK processing inhibitor BofA family protein [Bacillota bacterium]